MDEFHLSDADSFTVHLENDPLLRSTIVAVAVFDRAPQWSRLCASVERATRIEPKFRRRIVAGTGPLMPSRWVDDEDFDLSWHLRRVAAPDPGTFDEVLEFARIAGMSAFDPVRPRWEFTLVEDLADGTAALVMKVHHALTDGIGGIQLAHHIVDLDRRGHRRREVPMPASGPSETLAHRATDAVAHDVGRIESAIVGLTRGVVSAFVHRPLRFGEELGRLASSVFRFVRPITTTLSPVMTQRRLGWNYHSFEVPLKELAAASRRAAGTLNDGFLAGIAGGLAEYHELHENAVEELRVTMPISTRSDDDAEGGNHITLVRFTVPVGHHDPTSRMLTIDHTARQWRAEPAIGWSEAIAGALNLLPTSVAAGMLKHVDVLASNVPGFDVKVFVAGARLERFYAFGPTMGSAANITLMSYCGRCCIGVTTDAGAVPDHGEFVECLRRGFDELLAIEP